MCGGLIGLILALIGTFRGERPSRRRILLVVTGAVVQLVFATAFATVSVIGELRTCPAATQSDGSGAEGRPEGGGGAWQSVRTVVNAPVSGVALLYGVAKNGQAYQCTANGTTAIVLENGFARGGTMYGSVFLTDQHTEAASPRMRRLSEHEARHSDQWAVSALLAGPAGLPALYAIDEAFFPGAYNHFEQHAGLEEGGYAPPPDGPPAAGRLAFLSIGLLVGYGLAASPRLRRPAAPERALALTSASRHTVEPDKQEEAPRGA